MSDAPVKLNAPVPHKARQNIRGGRGGGIIHSKNKTWVSGRASASSSPLPEGRWERGRGGITIRGRGGRNANTANGHVAHDTSESANATEDEDDGSSNARASRFATTAVVDGVNVEEVWRELVKAREVERAQAIREGRMDDPTKPKRLDEAITMVGTCQDMCPEFERYRRAREKNLDKWECIIGEDGNPTKEVDHARAVKIYERGQGDKIIPSDLRPAPVLKRTLDYLFHDLIHRGGFSDTQAFVRDRSRAVRNDFTIQQDTGPVAMDCHERCTRFHILSLHLMYGVPTFDRSLEIQQLMNSLLSLKEFYDDQRGTYQSPNELEMRIYHRLGLIRDQGERNDRPPPHIASDPAFQLITRFRSEVQAASSPITKTSKMKVNAAAMQTFGELANVLRERRNIIMIYLIACFLEHIFGKDTIDDMESIKGPLTIQDIIDGNSEIGEFAGMGEGAEDTDTAMDEENNREDQEDTDDLSAFIEGEDDIAEDEMALETVNEDSPLPSPLKRGATQWLTENFGNPPTPPQASTSQSQSTPASSSLSPFGASTSRSPFGTASAGESVFGKLVGSSSAPSIFGDKGPSSVFGTAMNVFSSSGNVFGGPVFGVPSPGIPSPRPPASIEPSKKSRSPSLQHSATSVLQETKPLRSLADAAPLDSTGEEDRVAPSEAVRTPSAPPPFAASQSAPVLNPEAPIFSPGPINASTSSIPFVTGSRASLAPIRTDSLLNNIVDPDRGIFATPVASPSYPFPSPQKPSNGTSLSINTGAALRPNNTRKAYAIDSPIGPPPLSRKAPISLPGTPTASFSSAGIPPIGPTTPSTPYHFPGLQVNISATTTSVPNPNPPSSPGPRLFNPSPTPDRFPSIFSSPLAVGSPIPCEDLAEAFPSKEELNKKAMDFRNSHGPVASSFKKWRTKTTDTIAWKNACMRSDAYKQKIHESSSFNSLPIEGSSSMPSSSSFKRQRSSSAIVMEPSRSRRRLKRVSTPHERRTDEEIAEQLMQNRKEHERRWAAGSFVRAIRNHVRSRARKVPPSWATWLCMNPDNDQTAIWLEKKFDVPHSGKWESETVFTVLISDNSSPEVFPGLIVFECTPLEGVDDEIERKYRVLDDCSRLREIISMLPEHRYFTPSLLFVNWDSNSSGEVASDILDMVVKHVEDGIIRSSISITISSDDVDQTFATCLTALGADIKGELVEKVTLSDVFDRLSPPWKEATSIWVDACFSEEIFNWIMFSHVLECFVESLNVLYDAALGVWKKNSMKEDLLSPPSFGRFRDNESVPKAIYEWLQEPNLNAEYLASRYLISSFDEETEALALFEHLLYYVSQHAQQSETSAVHRIVTKAALKEAELKFSNNVEEVQTRLRITVKSLPRVSPKRKSNGDSITNGASGDSISQASSPSPSLSAKRPRISTGEESFTDGLEQEQSFVVPPSPTPSAALSVGNSSVTSVSVAALRALSRDILKTYGSGKRGSTS